MTCNCPAISAKVEERETKPHLRNHCVIISSLLLLATQRATVCLDYLAPFRVLSVEAAVSRAHFRVILCIKGSLLLNTEEFNIKNIILGLQSQPPAGLEM